MAAILLPRTPGLRKNLALTCVQGANLTNLTHTQPRESHEAMKKPPLNIAEISSSLAHAY